MGERSRALQAAEAVPHRAGHLVPLAVHHPVALVAAVPVVVLLVAVLLPAALPVVAQVHLAVAPVRLVL